MIKVLVTGVCGQLGFDVANALLHRGYDVVGADIQPENSCGVMESLDCGKYDKDESNEHLENIQCGRFTYVNFNICRPDDVRSELLNKKPDVVIHCAAWTAVDAAEWPENADKVYAVNVEGTRNIAEICQEIACKMVYISTDYVFDGQGSVPWNPDCKTFAPLNVYGRTKLQGEQVVEGLLDKFFIVRIAWVFGRHGRNFVDTMLRLAGSHDELRVVDDQIGTPTYTPDLARLLADMIETDKYGYYHATNEGGFISWYDFACEIFRQSGSAVRVIPVSTEEYGLSRAARPHNSRLDKSKLMDMGFAPLPDWRDALRRYLIDSRG